MKRRALLVAALGTLAVPASALAANPGAVPNCLGKPVVKPGQLVLFCGDGNESVSRLRWVGWGSAFAAGQGTASINDCTPNCAGGHDHSYPVVLVLTGRETCKPSGKLAYARITVAFIGSAPKQEGNQSFTFPCRPFR